MLDTTTLRVPGPEFPGIKKEIVTLVRIGGGRVMQAIAVGEKRALLLGGPACGRGLDAAVMGERRAVLMEDLPPDSVFLAVWTGQWCSQVFQVPPELLESWRALLAL